MSEYSENGVVIYSNVCAEVCVPRCEQESVDSMIGPVGAFAVGLFLVVVSAWIFG